MFNKINPLNVTIEMELLENFIIIIALHVSCTSRPSSGAYKTVRVAYSDGMRYLINPIGEKCSKHIEEG
jgi:hypothetical protein